MGKYKVVWRAKARRLYINHLSYAYQEYGTKALKIVSIWDMRMNPKKLEQMVK